MLLSCAFHHLLLLDFSDLAHDASSADSSSASLRFAPRLIHLRWQNDNGCSSCAFGSSSSCAVQSLPAGVGPSAIAPVYSPSGESKCIGNMDMHPLSVVHPLPGRGPRSNGGAWMTLANAWAAGAGLVDVSAQNSREGVSTMHPLGICAAAPPRCVPSRCAPSPCYYILLTHHVALRCILRHGVKTRSPAPFCTHAYVQYLRPSACSAQGTSVVARGSHRPPPTFIASPLPSPTTVLPPRRGAPS